MRARYTSVSFVEQSASERECNIRFHRLAYHNLPKNHLGRAQRLAFDAISPSCRKFGPPLTLGAEIPGMGAVLQTDIPETTFEPVLNVPALGSFLFVAVIFVFLQIRVILIERAADRRNAALDELRYIKSKELSAVGEDAVDSQKVKEAIEKYRKAYEEVESLRELLPGARVIPPPGGAAQQRMKENQAAAQQFLGIEVEKSEPNEDKDGKGLSPIQVGLLGFVFIIQISLLFFLLQDPMSPSNFG